MTHEYGRSLMEVIATMAITGAMMASAFTAYTMFRNNQIRQMASTTLEGIASDTKLLLEMRGDYTGVSIDYLVAAGALNNNNAPIGGDEWSVTADIDGQTFSINLTELTNGECTYFVSRGASWAEYISVNGNTIDIDSACFTSTTNQVSFIVR